MVGCQVREKLLSLITHSQELALDLRQPEDRFKWLLASMLFAKRIPARTAMATFRHFEHAGLTTPETIVAAGWDRLVEILDAGGYVRYDFSTASTLLEAMDKLLKTYGSLEKLHDRAVDSRDLEQKLQELKGIGPVAANIFLRELRSVWSKANSMPSPVSLAVARKLGLAESDVKLPGMESALVRVHLDFCKKKKCGVCPVKEDCSQ
jgi:endonuclease III